MTRTIEIATAADLSSWTDITALVDRKTFKFAGRAYNGESSPSGFNYDDDAAAMTLPAHRVVRVTEDATSPDTVLFWGRIQDKGIGRGQIFDGDARAFDVALADVNAELRGISILDWSRPAETAEARLRAFILAYCNGSWRASTDLDGSTWVPLTHTTMMEKKRYRGTTSSELISDVLTATGKLLFVTQDGEVFFDRPTSTAYASTISITDDGSDDGLTVFAPIWDGTADEQAGDQVTSGGVATYGTGAVVSARRSAIEAAYDRWEDAVSSDAKSGAGAKNDLDRMLDGHAIEDDTIRCSIILLDSQADLVKHGMTLAFRGAAAGVTSPRTLRVASCEKSEAGPGRYLYRLELGFPRKIRGRINHGVSPKPGPPPTELPPPPFVSVPCVVDFSTALGGFVVVDTDGGGLNQFVASGSGAAITGYAGGGLTAQSPQSFTLPATLLASIQLPATPGAGLDTGALRIGVALSSGALLEQGAGMHLNDTGGLHIYGAGGSGSPVTTDIPAGSLVWVRVRIESTGSVGVQAWPAADPSNAWGVGYGPPVGFVPPDVWSLQVIGGSTDPYIIESLSLVTGGDCTGPSGAPAGTAGLIYGPVDLGFGDGVRSTFQLPYPYAPGTIEAFVGGTFQPVVEVDPAAGTFAFTFVPSTLMSVTVGQFRIAPAAVDVSPPASPGVPGSGGGSGTGDLGDVYGSAVELDTKANLRVGPDGTVAHRFRASTSANLVAIRFPQRGGPTHADPSADGYSTQNGDGGSMTITVQGDDGSGNPDGTPIASVTYSPANPTGDWSTYERVELDTPVALTAGTLYHIVYPNDDPTFDSYISINHIFVYGSALTPRQPVFPDADYATLTSMDGGATWSPMDQYTATLDLEYDDSTHDGQAYISNMVEAPFFGVIAGSSKMVREAFTVSGGSKTVTGAYARMRRSSGTGDLTLTLEQSDGTFLDSVTIPYTDVPASAAGSDNGGSVLVGGAFGSSQVLNDGDSYCLRLSTPDGTEYTTACIREGTAVGFASFAFRDGTGQRSLDGGTTWTDLYPYDAVDIQFFFTI